MSNTRRIIAALKVMNSLKFGVVLVCLSLVFGLQLGCETTGSGMTGANDASTNAAPHYATGSTDTTFRSGDRVIIDFTDNVGLPSNWQQTIREDGTITLPLGKTVHADGLQKGEVETAIHDVYVPHILRRLTVNVRSEQRSYFVSGEVKTPGQRDHTGLITAMKAISAAGDFTDYANKSKIDIFRANGEIVRVNGKKALKDPRQDKPVYPGDRVHVYRRIL